jgi:hypothetical protein
MRLYTAWLMPTASMCIYTLHTRPDNKTLIAKLHFEYLHNDEWYSKQIWQQLYVQQSTKACCDNQRAAILLETLLIDDQLSWRTGSALVVI